MFQFIVPSCVAFSMIVASRLSSLAFKYPLAAFTIYILSLTSAFGNEAAMSFRHPLNEGGWHVSQDFAKWNNDWSAYHLGEDDFVDSGTELPVYAPANGVVRHNASKTGFGRVVIIEHRLPDNTYVCAVLGHMRAAGIVGVGSDVTKGQLVGYLSSDFNENGGYGFTHLHFGIRAGAYTSTWVYMGYAQSISNWFDPTNYVNANANILPRIVTGFGSGIRIAGATITLTANSTVQTLMSDANGYWYLPWVPGGNIEVSIYRPGYRILHYIVNQLTGSKSSESDVMSVAGIKVNSHEDQLIPDSIALSSTRFQQNDRVQVTNTGIGLRARHPMYDSTSWDVMSDGEQGTVIGGPIPFNGYNWWLIEYDSLSPSLSWSAEGEPATSGVYYLTKISVSGQFALSVSPGNQSVGASAGLAYFNVSKTGTGNMNWTASSNAGWLHITSGASGTNSGTIQCYCDANSGSTQRIGTIQVTASGASGSPMNVTVTQAGTATPPPHPPVIVVTYQSRQGPEIVIGDFTPSGADGTDFGNIPVRNDVEPAYRTFVIQNYGNGMLYLTGSPTVRITGDSDFAIYEQPPSTSVDPWDGSTNGATGFSVVFDPHSQGLRTAVVTIQSNDTNHSPYQFAIQGTGVLPVLSVNSTGAAGVPIMISPTDSNGRATGATNFSASYSPGTQVTLTAPVQIADGSVFSHWSGYYSEGESATGTTLHVTVNFDRTVTANYETRLRTLSIQSSGASGAAVTASPADRNGQGDGITNATLTYNNGAYVALTAPSTSGGKAFIDWSGVDGQSGTVGYLTMNSDRTAIANYFDPSALTMDSITPNSGPVTGNTLVTITGSNFAEPMNVSFGGIPGTSVTVLNTRVLTVVTPVGTLPGAVDVAVSTSSSSRTIVSGFVYLGSPNQTRVLWPPSGMTPYRFGTWGLKAIDDINNDGIGDIIVTDNNASFSGGPSSAGCAFVYSGKTGALLHTLRSPNEIEAGLFGVSASAVPDVDGDDIQDIVIGAGYEYSGTSPRAAGRAHLFSGRSGSLLQTMVSPNEQLYGEFGYSVSSVEDIDGDGKGDVIVGAPYEDRNIDPTRRGCVYVLSGSTGSCIRTLSSQNPAHGGLFGFSVSGIPDLNGDGLWDVVAGTTLTTADPHAYVFSGSNGSILRSLTFANRASSYFVGACVVGVPDINGDDVPDLLIGDADWNTQAGQVLVMSGSDGSLLRTLVSPNQQSSGFFGRSLCAIADVDADGVPDIVAGAASENPGGSPRSAGRAYVFSGQTGNLLRTLSSPEEKADGAFGISVAAIGDVNNNRIDEVAVGTVSEERVYIFPMHFAPPQVLSVLRIFGPVTNAAEVSYTVEFSDDVTGVDASDFSVTAGGGVSGAAITGLTGTGFQYTVSVNTGTGDGNLRLDVNGSGTAIVDLTGSPLVGGYAAGEAYFIDKTHPIITITGENPAIVSQGEPYEDAGATATDSHDGVLTTSIDTMGLPLDTYILGSHTVTYTVADEAGNQIQATRHVDVVDDTPPEVAISEPSVALTNSGPVHYTVTYTDAANVTLRAQDVTLLHSGTATGTVEIFGAGNESREVRVTGIAGDGTLGISLAAGTATDAAGNNAGSTNPSASFAVDNTAPLVSISAPSTALTRSGPVTYTISCGGADAVSLATNNVSLNKTGSADGTVSVSVADSATCTVTIANITGDGTLGISLAAGTASDAAGNLAAGAGPSETFTVDNTPPTVVIHPPSVSVTHNGPVTYSVTYSGAHTVMLADRDISLLKTGTANGQVAVSSAGNEARTVTVSGITGNGTLAISIAAGSATDAVGLLASAAGPSAIVTVQATDPADIDSDGKLNATDVQLVINAVLGRPVNGIPDINHDGKLNATDVQLVINAILGRF